jgi:hypothetical protein
MYLMIEELARDRMRQVHRDAEQARLVHRARVSRREQRRSSRADRA